METINILCATDNNYAPYCGIMLTSLFESNKDCHFVVYVFEDGSVTEENVSKYQRLAKKYRNEIVLKTIDESMVKAFPMTANAYITMPTYYRLLAANLLPSDVHRVIYLDCDIIVNGDIKPLWDVNLGDKALAGIRGCSDYVQHHCERLGYPKSFDYFNAGVLTLDLDFWRMNQMSEKVYSFILHNSSALLLMDQDALNGVFYSKKILLPSRYNFQVLLFDIRFWGNYSCELRYYYLEECNRASIIHFAGSEKPWDYRHYGGPFFSLWDKYRKKSLWRDCRDTKPMKKHVKHMVKRYLFPGLFRKQHPEWVLTDETKCYYC